MNSFVPYKFSSLGLCTDTNGKWKVMDDTMALAAALSKKNIFEGL